MSLLEREGLLDELGSRLRAAATGHGSLVLMGAEAGAGKTSVVTEFGRRCGNKAHVLVGGCDPLTTPRPLSPLIDIALDPRSRLSGSFAAEAAPYELFTALQRRMADSDVPLVIVIEDVHWADEGTLDFLRFIGRRVEALPSLVLATFRDDEVGPQHPARPVIGELTSRPAVTLLPVPPLSVEAVTALAGGDAALAARIHRVTDGNAFYVTEVLASGEEVPSTVKEAVLARAARLGEGARRVVEVVATAPRSLELEVALEVAHAGPEDADEAVAAGVLLADRGHLRFRHELALALSQLGHARFRAGLDDQVAAPIEECLRLLTSSPDSPAKARAYAQVAMVNMLQRQYAPALAAAEPALEAARRLGDDRLLGRTLITLGATEVVMGDAHRGVALLKEARELGERVGAADVSRLAVWMLGSGAGEARLYHEAEEALAALVAAAVDTDDDAALAYGVAWQARIAFERGEYGRALRLAERVPPRPGHGIIGPITALGAKGRTMVRLGQPGAGDVLRQALAVSPHAALQYVWSPWCGLAELAWLEGREGDIPGLLAHVLPLVLASDSPWARGEVSLWSWKARTMEVPLPGSAEPFAALVRGDWRRSAELWAQLGCPYERAFALAHGDEEAMREALGEFRRLGAQPAAARLVAAMRERGISRLPRGPRRVTKGHPALLTARQAEVLELMVAGRTNAEIAERLAITEKTAEHHVSAVLAKLGAPNRASAVAMALGMGLVTRPDGPS